MLKTKGDAKRFGRLGFVLLGFFLLIASRACCAKGRDFCVVVLPDPQLYAAQFPQVGLAQTEWISRNIARLQIKFSEK
jgi:hypothetical protein